MTCIVFGFLVTVSLTSFRLSLKFCPFPVDNLRAVPRSVRFLAWDIYIYMGNMENDPLKAMHCKESQGMVCFTFVSDIYIPYSLECQSAYAILYMYSHASHPI